MIEEHNPEVGIARAGRTAVGEPTIATVYTHNWEAVDIIDRGVALAVVYFDSATKQGHEFRIPASRVPELARAIEAYLLRARGRS